MSFLARSILCNLPLPAFVALLAICVAFWR